MANILPRGRQIAVIPALTEGMSIRSVERLTGIHRDTIMRLGAKVGRGCAALHDEWMRDLPVTMIELDELWSYVGKKQRRVQPTDTTDLGDQYVFVAIGALNKLIISYRVGKRDMENTEAFVRDLRKRVVGRPQISSDAWPAYEPAFARAFEDCDYGQIIKSYNGEPPVNAARRDSPGWIVAVDKRVISGRPRQDKISTSYIERSNLNVRMDCRRFTRLSNGYSKKLANHEAAVALFVAAYNLTRVHSALKTTPAVAMGITNHVWSIAELVDEALAAGRDEPSGPDTTPDPTSLVPSPVRGRPQLRVIQGGLA
jgi:IS1 family transposase